jgi:hypothetical protein
LWDYSFKGTLWICDHEKQGVNWIGNAENKENFMVGLKPVQLDTNKYQETPASMTEILKNFFVIWSKQWGGGERDIQPDVSLGWRIRL